MIADPKIESEMHLSGYGSFFLVRGKEPQLINTTLRTASLPMPIAMLIGRIIHNAWFVNKYFSKEGNYDLLVSAAQGRRLIKIDLEEGQCLRFHVKYLVGWSEKMRMHTDINLSASRIANKAIFVQESAGPGTMLFEVSGKPYIVNKTQPCKMSADRLVAWSADTRFKLSGAYTLIDLYVNPPLLAIAGNGMALLDSDDNRHSMRNGILRIIRKFYLP